MHPLLNRQLKRLGIDALAGVPSAELWAEVMRRVSCAYEDHDQELYLLERSQDLASQEMAALYATLRADRDLLDSRVRERTDALQLSEARLSSLLSLSADWIWEQDEELRFTYLSSSIRAAVGIEPSLMLGRKRLTDESCDVSADARTHYDECVTAHRPFRDFTYGLTRPDGVLRYVRISGEPVFDREGKFRGYRGVGRDVTSSAIAERKIQDLARFDSLTGLSNRNTFLEELDRLVARSRRHGTELAVCFIDLDRFKAINDTLGHDAGDELLKLMASRLKDALRESDVVARLGGDEFVVLIEDASTVADVTLVGQKILAAVGAPVTLQGCTFLVTASVGVAQFPSDGDSATTLLKHADGAMYLAKQRGRNNLQFYTAELADESARLFALESELRLALARNELVLYYQPKVNIANGLMVGTEALVRWNHPSRGLVMPNEFIPLAEERGLIVPLGRWVMRAACRQIRDWRLAGLTPLPVAVNLSAREFASDSLVKDLVDAMKDNGVAPTDMEIELTESALMAEPERASAVLCELSSMGIRVAIDDFGTGYSSLSYLKRFPAKTVKIDRSFIHGLPADTDDTAITQAVVAMAHSLGLNVVAEGVETPMQMAALRSLGCDEAQGYLIGRPMSANALSLLLTRESEQLAFSG